MSSQSFFDRITSPRIRSPILPLHKTSKRSSNEYQLTQLDPRPDDNDTASLDDGLPTAWLNEQDVLGTTPREFSPNSWREKPSPESSSSKTRPKPMFSGPPPPISSSMIMSKDYGRGPSTSPSARGRNFAPSPSKVRTGVSSLLFDHSPELTSHNFDSIWRSLRWQEKALEQDVQQLLDQQATALIAGSGNDIDGHSTGSSTPTGTFYSTKSSKSRMTNSLYVPTRATPDGNVIPVRQPTNDRPPGLRPTRAALRKVITAMAKLKKEENAYLEDALSQRKEALSYLDQLSSRRGNIQNEMQSLEEDIEEPLGKELRELTSRHDTMNEDIRRLEEKLVGMRNQRRVLRGKIEDVKSKREAGLSGYKGALRDVESEVTALIHRPPIQLLDPELSNQYGEMNGNSTSSGGKEFLRLIPERRTLDMAKSWWEAEVATIERCRKRINADRQALEEGGVVWDLVIRLVTDFESSLRQLMKPGGPSPSSSTRKGKEKEPSQQELISIQLGRMKGVLEELDRHMQLAEEKRWNLLICTIGAELEAFREAYSLLEALANVPDDSTKIDENLQHDADAGDHSLDVQERHYRTEESDNEVPPDLLGAQVDNRDTESVASNGASLQRVESENEVPPEFLAEHA